ncbi:MAG: DUF456 domain-containing protein [Spirochaetaceae bacterium]|nr:DUF456 domain-containing protein [Spirochaetaceae bacterium]
MGFDVFLAILGAICLLIGTVGCVVPVLPGVILAWAGLLSAYFSYYCTIPTALLVATGITTAIVSVLDNIIPIYLTKKTGGSKAGMWGSTIGLIAGIFVGPWGIVLGPFVGALVGELIHDNRDTKRAFKSASGAFLGFLLGTGLKLVLCGFLIWIYIQSFKLESAFNFLG